MNFQKAVLVLAILLLIIMLVFIGVTLSKSKSEEQWPPIIGDCPDYWVDLSGNGAHCVNTHNLGTCNRLNDDPNFMDFTTSTYTGSNGMCNKYTWATNCGVSWDGITYGAPNPCSTTTSSAPATTS